MNTSATNLLQDFVRGEIPVRELTAEASPRRYFRATQYGSPWLFVKSPQRAPVAITKWMASLGVRVPEIGAVAEGVYLVQDLGDVHLSHAPTLEHYIELMRTWGTFAFATLPSDLPNAKVALDAVLFERELAQFKEAYLEKFLSSELSMPEYFAALAQGAAKGPQALQHRDFHCRNVLFPDVGLTIIDHQDLRMGPLFYDLASLLTDAYLDLSDGVLSFLTQQIPQLGARFNLSAKEAQEHFQRVATQRVLKALGTFGWLLNQGRQEYAEAEVRARAHACRLLDGQEGAQDLLRVLSA